MHSDIGLISKGNSSIVNQNTLNLRCSLINKQVHSWRHIDQIPVNWWHISPPGPDVRPPHHVLENFINYGIAIAYLDHESIFGGELQPCRYVACYCCCIVLQDSTCLAIDGDARDVEVEVTTREGEIVPSEYITSFG